MRIEDFRIAAQRSLFRYGWDTRCRNVGAASQISSALANEKPGGPPILLDIGCGNVGIAAFLPNVSVLGVDVDEPREVPPNFRFQKGDATSLPFEDQSFPVVSCVDVLEHLAPSLRVAAIGEMMRIASRTVLIAFPHGETADECDRLYYEACSTRGLPIPAWLNEHRQQAYPTADGVLEAVAVSASELGRAISVSMTYSEPSVICRLVRAAAVRSGATYGIVNLAFGLLYPLIPAPRAGDSYRAILRVDFTPSNDT